MAIIKKKIENLKPGKEYVLTVRAKNSDLNVLSDYSDSIRFQVPNDATTPSALSNLQLFSGLENVMFVFDYSQDLDVSRYEYELYQNYDMSDEGGPLTGFADANVFTVRVSNLQLEEDGGGLAPFWGRARTIDTTGNVGPWTSLVQTDPHTPLIDNQYIGSLTASKITAGTIGAHTITLNSASSIIKSSNFDGEAVGDGSYSNATTGWLINGQGKAYFYDATVVGSIDIGGFDSGSFHVNTSGDMWLGAGTYGAAPFRVSREGVLEIGAGTGSRIGGQLIDTIAETVIDFNGRNNRKSTTPATPTSVAFSTATSNTNASIDLPLSWTFTGSGDAYDIDGFIVFLRTTTTTNATNITTSDLDTNIQQVFLTAEKRSHTFSGISPSAFYRAAVRAYRVVDSDIDPAGVIYGPLLNTTQRTATIPIIGGSTGIKIGDGSIYIGTGNYDNLDTGFYVDSTGKFSLKDKLVWNGTTLTVKGTLQFSDGTTPGTFDNGDAITAGSIAGVTINSTKMYIGTGTFNNANTAFYVDNAGQLSLKDKLSWNGTTLTVTGSITGSTITGSTLKTAATGDRVEINSNDIYLYNTATSTTSIKFDGTSVPAAFGVIQSLNAGIQIKGSGSTTYTVGAAAAVSEYQWDGSTGRMLTLSRVTGSTLLSVAGSINATAVTTTGNLNASQVQLSGASAGYYQYDRSNQSINWTTYVDGGFYRIYNSVYGDRLALSSNDLYIYNLQVNAGGSSLRYIAGGQITSAASKKSLKNNIDYNISGLSIINKLKPASFTWKKTEMESEEVGKIKALHKNYGFIAEDVAEIDGAIAVLEPVINENMTQEEKVNSYRNIDSWIPSYYSETGILALAVKSIQELSERLEILENK